MLQENFKTIEAEFPNALVIASTFDNFTQHLPSVAANLAVITECDSFIYYCDDNVYYLDNTSVADM
jgi:hypothetical protein